MKQTQIGFAAAIATLQHTQPALHPTSLKTTAATLAVAAPPLHLLRDGEVVLYKRNRSRVWQCKYKLFTGRWVRISTRKTVLEHAARVAALPPEISHMTAWSPITPERKLDDEKAIYGGADHWLPA